MTEENTSKVCFVIAPIGQEDSDTRTRSDQVLKHIILPAAQECGYETVRADQISEPGLITSQVIQHVVDDPLVIADLTGRNPNVSYELALRHAIKKPVVQIIQASEPIPFDIAATRTIHVDHHDLDSAATAREEIMRQIRSVERNPTEVDTPISVAIELQMLRQSDNPLEKSNAEIISMLQQLQTAITDLRDEPRQLRMDPLLVQELGHYLGRISSLISLNEDGTPPDVDQLEEAVGTIERLIRIVEHLGLEAGIPRARMSSLIRRMKP